MFSSTPAGWDPAVEPPCAAGEARRDYPWTMWGGPTPHPPQVAPGFAAAWRAGILPPPPSNEPPSALPGMAASARTWAGALTFFGGGIGGLMVIDKAGLPAVLLPLVGALAIATSYWLFSSVAARADAEHGAGYTTLPAAGTWRLNSGGAVVSTPDRSMPPPGWYPSPYFPGMLQRWNGPGWTPLPQRWTRRSTRYFRAVEPWWVASDRS